MMPDLTGPDAFRARVRGRVQGVGFRWTCSEDARRLGLCGWVRNLVNGDVEVWAEGSAAGLESLLQWLRRGPSGAWVESVQYEKQKPAGKFRSFEIRN
jgi:acylphosphatase